MRDPARLIVREQYLNDLTWTRGTEHTERLRSELYKAIDEGVHILLAHEMPGLYQTERDPCEFGNFFACDRGSTSAAPRTRQTALCAG